MYKALGFILGAITIPVVWTAFIWNVSPYICPDWLNQLASYIVFVDCMFGLSWAISSLVGER
jgi:hypothetical protein